MTKWNLQKILETINGWCTPAGLRFALVLWRVGRHNEKKEIYVGAHPNDHHVLPQILGAARESVVEQQAGKHSGLILPPGMQ